MINKFLTFDWNFSDDETVAYFINFIKSISLKLDDLPIELFYNMVKN